MENTLEEATKKVEKERSNYNTSKNCLKVSGTVLKAGLLSAAFLATRVLCSPEVLTDLDAFRYLPLSELAKYPLQMADQLTFIIGTIGTIYSSIFAGIDYLEKKDDEESLNKAQKNLQTLIEAGAN